MFAITMSIRATNFVRHLRGLSTTEKAVAFVLADHDSHKGNGSFPSMSTVAMEAGLENRESASRITKRLVDRKILLSDNPSGGRKPTVYRFNFGLSNRDSPVTATVTPESQLTVTTATANRDSGTSEI